MWVCFSPNSSVCFCISVTVATSARQRLRKRECKGTVADRVHLCQYRNDTLIAHLHSPHRGRLWGSQALCKGRTEGCAGVFLCRIDFSHSVMLPPISMAGGLPAQIATELGPLFLVRLTGSKSPQEMEWGWQLCTSGFSLHRAPAMCPQDPHSSALTGQLFSFFKFVMIKPASSSICLYFHDPIYTLYLSPNLQSFSGIPLEGLILSSFERNQPAHSGCKAVLLCSWYLKLRSAQMSWFHIF